MQTRTNTSRGVTDQNGRAAPRSDHRNTARGREGGGGNCRDNRQSAGFLFPPAPEIENPRECRQRTSHVAISGSSEGVPHART